MVMATKERTEADVLEAWREKLGMNKSNFAAELHVSRQEYNNYMNGKKQNVQGLQESAVKYVGTWIGELCIDLLKVRGAEIPCVCLLQIGDNGHCPKHGLVCDDERGQA